MWNKRTSSTLSSAITKKGGTIGSDSACQMAGSEERIWKSSIWMGITENMNNVWKDGFWVS